MTSLASKQRCKVCATVLVYGNTFVHVLSTRTSLFVRSILLDVMFNTIRCPILTDFEREAIRVSIHTIVQSTTHTKRHILRSKSEFENSRRQIDDALRCES